MRILIASRNFFPDGVVGGAQLSANLLAQQLVRNGHEVAILSVDNDQHWGIHASTQLKEYRIKLRNLYTRGSAPLYKRTAWHAIDRLGHLMDKDYLAAIEDFRPDLINTNVLAGLGIGIWRAALRKKVPIVHTVHDYYLLCVKSGMRSGSKNCDRLCTVCSFAKSLAAPISSQVGEVIYVSQHMRQTHSDYGMFEGVRSNIIHGTYDPPEGLPARSAFLTDGVLTLGYFGRISPEKGVDRLIAALKKLKGVSWRMRLGGGGAPDYVDKMKKLAAGSPIEFLGIQNPNDFYSRVDAVVISSLWHDPAPRVAYEAGLHGVVPIVANRGGLPELIGYGDRGLMFEPDDDDTLIHAIQNLAANPNIIRGFQQKWRQITETFSAESVAQETTAIFERAANYKKG